MFPCKVKLENGVLKWDKCCLRKIISLRNRKKRSPCCPKYRQNGDRGPLWASWGNRTGQSPARIYCVSSGKVTPLLQKTFENMAKMSKILSNYPSSFRLENRQAWASLPQEHLTDFAGRHPGEGVHLEVMEIGVCIIWPYVRSGKKKKLLPKQSFTTKWQSQRATFSKTASRRDETQARRWGSQRALASKPEAC